MRSGWLTVMEVLIVQQQLERARLSVILAGKYFNDMDPLAIQKNTGGSSMIL